MAKVRKTLRVNGDTHTLEIDENEPLLWVLRERLGLTGTKFGCGEGACGACSVLIDGQEVASCRVAAASVSGPIVTIEGLGSPGHLSPVQQAFAQHTAFACGYCTPGMIVAATALLRQNPAARREDIVRTMNRHLCRCAVYPNILEAIASLAAQPRGDDA